jgi:hypothetical protein
LINGIFHSEITLFINLLPEKHGLGNPRGKFFFFSFGERRGSLSPLNNKPVEYMCGLVELLKYTRIILRMAYR